MAPSRPAGPTQLKIFEQWMETTKWLMARTERFPKRLRHTLTDRIDLLAIELLEDLTTAAWRRDKREVLEAADARLRRLRVLTRLAHELAILSHGHYEEAAKRLAETGRLLGGWLRSLPA